MKPAESLVLVPGLMCDAEVWHHQAAWLGADRQIQVAEHGFSDSLDLMAERILDLAPPRFALAGHSMGGRVALEVIARAPQRVSKLALLDTGYEGFSSGARGEQERAGRFRLLDMARREGMAAMARDWAQGMVHPARLTDATLMEAIHAMVVRAGIERFEAQINALLHRPERTSLLTRLRVPTLVLCGFEDGWSPFARHQTMAGLIDGSRLIGIPDCGHMSTMERPEPVTSAMRRWLSD